MNEDETKIREGIEKENETKNRFQKLSEQVIAEKIQNETLAKSKTEAENRANEMEKEKNFYKDFSVNVSKYPAASQYQDQILEKVRRGYTTADAMVSVLASEGKLNSPSEPVQSAGQVEGGSAPNSLPGDKSIYDMTAAEKLAALAEIDKTGGLANALRGR